MRKGCGIDHPYHLRDEDWVNVACRDIYDTTNDMTALKHKVNGASIKERMEAVGIGHLFGKNYSALSDYSHLVLRSNALYEKEKFNLASAQATQSVLCSLTGICSAVCNFYDLEFPESLIERVKTYLDRYADNEINNPPPKNEEDFT